MKSVGVSGAEGALRSRIADALSQISDEVLSFTYEDGDIDLEGVECLVHLAFSDDSDQRNLIDLLEHAEKSDISQLVMSRCGTNPEGKILGRFSGKPPTL